MIYSIVLKLYTAAGFGQVHTVSNPKYLDRSTIFS